LGGSGEACASSVALVRQPG